MNKYLLFIFASFFMWFIVVDVISGISSHIGLFAILSAIFFVGGMICSEIEKSKK